MGQWWNDLLVEAQGRFDDRRQAGGRTGVAEVGKGGAEGARGGAI